MEQSQKNSYGSIKIKLKALCMGVFRLSCSSNRDIPKTSYKTLSASGLFDYLNSREHYKLKINGVIYNYYNWLYMAPVVIRLLQGVVLSQTSGTYVSNPSIRPHAYF